MYRAGTYKAVNLSFGKSNKVVGGILIRGLLSLDKDNCGNFIEGPCSILNEIFRVCSLDLKT